MSDYWERKALGICTRYGCKRKAVTMKCARHRERDRVLRKRLRDWRGY